jgi:AraC-like DNA-binding protein
MSDLSFYIFPNKNFIDLNLYQYGKEKCSPGHSFGPAKRNHYLFHYIISGEGILYSDDEKGNTNTYKLKEGQGFLIFPEQTNTYIADLNNPWEYIWIEFDGLRVKESLQFAGFTLGSPIYKPRVPELADMMKNEMLYLIEYNNSSPFNIIGHSYLFLDYLERSMTKDNAIKPNKLRDFYIKEAISYLENHFQEDITVEDIADNIGLNRSYFGKIFKEEVGKSPQSFIINYRMIKATELLQLTKMSINDISIAVGYPNQMNFSRAFKSIYGIPPAKWRAENRTFNNK